MQTLTASRSARVIALASALVLVPAVRAQGLRYDMTTTGTGADPRGGAAVTRTYMAGHGQFVTGLSRIDITQSMAPGGMMGTGTYRITNTAKGTTTIVDPAKRQYTELNPAELAKTAASMQQSLGGMVKTEITDVKVALEDLGAGESMEGYSTVKYRLTESYTMKMAIMGRHSQTTEHSTIEFWIAPQLDGIMNPTARVPASTGGGPMNELTAETAKAYAKVRKGAVLKTVMTNEGVEEGKTRSMTMTMTISNVKHASISPSVFEVPAGYTKVAALEALTPMGAIGDSINAARSRNAKKPSSRDDTPTPTEDDKAQVKKALGKIFGRPPL